MSGSADDSDPLLPWVYPYREDGTRLSSVVLRPIVPIRLLGREPSSPVFALVDSGCSHVLAGPWLADDAGVNPKSSDREILLGIGGETHTVRFVDMKIQLLSPKGGTDDEFIEWDDEVGFVEHWKPQWPVLVGQVAFMKRFTITMSRHSQAMAVEDAEAFDSRFSVPLAP